MNTANAKKCVASESDGLKRKGQRKGKLEVKFGQKRKNCKRPGRETNRGPQQMWLMLYHWGTETSDITSQFVWQFYLLSSTSQHRHHPMPMCRLTHFAQRTRHSHHFASCTTWKMGCYFPARLGSLRFFPFLPKLHFQFPCLLSIPLPLPFLFPSTFRICLEYNKCVQWHPNFSLLSHIVFVQVKSQQLKFVESRWVMP